MADDKKEAAAPKLVDARVLVKMTHEGKSYAVNDIISASAQVIKSFEGSVDPHEDAVGYAKGLIAKAKAKADDALE
jgi:hypothetical protein